MNKNIPLFAGLIISSAICATPSMALEITENEAGTTTEAIALPPSAPAPASKAQPSAKPVVSTNNANATQADTTKTSSATAVAPKANANTEKEAEVAKDDDADTQVVTRSTVAGEKVYITDNAYVWMTRGPGKQYRLNGTARAGDEATVLGEQNGYIQVRLPNGKTGWIPRSEIQRQTSFRNEVTTLRSENEALKFKLENVDSETARELKVAKAELASLKQERDTLAKKQAEDSAKLADIQARNEELEGKLETKAQDMQLRWWKEGGLIAGIGALAGIILVYLPRPRRRREDYY